jgi:hypothetical protein
MHSLSALLAFYCFLASSALAATTPASTNPQAIHPYPLLDITHALPGAVTIVQRHARAPTFGVGFADPSDVFFITGAPEHSATGSPSLPTGVYVFQVTDGSGSITLSSDPAKCRLFRVNDDGRIQSVVSPSSLGLNLTDTWTNIRGATVTCHREYIKPASQYDSGRVQLVPFAKHPQDHGMHKLWIVPLDVYIGNGGQLDSVPAALSAQVQDTHRLERQGGHERIVDNTEPLSSPADEGFSANRHLMKTSAFKVHDAQYTSRSFNAVHLHFI